MAYAQTPRSWRMLKFVSPILLSFVLSVLAVATATAQTNGTASQDQISKKAVIKYQEKAPDDPFRARLIPRNSRIYIAPMLSEDATKPQAQGFETYLAAALRKKDVPLIIVADRSQADFEIEGTADQKGAGWAKKLILADFRKSTSASMKVTNLKTGVVAYADSSDRASANRGLRSSAEKLAKYLKKKIEDDEKKR